MRNRKMSEGTIVILGTLAILSTVAVSTIALVYNRSLVIKAGSGEKTVQVETGDHAKKEGLVINETRSK